ncbi:sensory box protein [Asticcacaulis biprosthecium C19]|uniref:histidine kinase n=1 Tax=Asticcacaulis biprosthecium C19 TaxID=715226 RepID=F4QLY1_9CAUL|nr:PAS domain S-box protein [Asticcacaulis biprosthecium]EGF93553.1 sensory box protein [Asticcacaulis biprosthecium C19]
MTTKDDDDGALDGYLAAIVESSDDAIIGKTLDGIVTAWNASATRLFGYTPEEAIGQHISLIIPKDRLDEEFVIIGKVKEGQRLEHFETVRQGQNGRTIDISLTVSPIKDAKGRIVGVSKIARDISIAKRAERLAASLNAIVDASDDAIVSKTLDGVITSWNPSAVRIFGYTPDEAIGQHIGLIIPPDRIDEEYTILGKIGAGQKVDHFETLRRHKDGSFVELAVTVSPLLDGRGRVMGATKVARPIAEAKQTERALRESNRRKDEFLANMSHELRTPMNAVIGLAHILGMSENLNPKEQQCVAMLKQSGDNLLGLINNLLDFSRLESDALELEVLEFNPADVVENSMIMIQLKAQEKDLPIRVTYDRNIKDRYLGDPARLQQILTNLLANAVKFTDEGQIDVAVRIKAERLNDTVLAFDVTDTGIGIAADKAEMIFDTFTQADASMTRKYGGSGLGLSICRALARAMNGSISVVSRPGIGSTFTVELTFKNASRQNLLTPRSEAPERQHRNVLVVEDYEPNTLVATTMIEHLGYSFDVAQNGMEALRKAERGTFDVILMDIQMPGMDGFESTRLIRDYEAEQQMQPTPIVAMTAHVLDKDKNLCIEAGMNDFIPKPFDPGLLRDILARYTGREGQLARA